MKIFVVRHRTSLALAVCVAIGVGGLTLAQHTGKGPVKVTQLSQGDIIEKLDGKDASATVEEPNENGLVAATGVATMSASEFKPGD